MLEVDGLESFYGASQALFGIGLRIEPGEMVTLLGRNGMGNRIAAKAHRTTTRP